MTAAAHARIAPSSLQRIIDCPRSVREIEKLPERPSSDEADEGTMLHDVAADCLRHGVDPHGLMDEVYLINGKDYRLSEDDADKMLPCIDWIREQPGDVYIEHRVSLNTWMKGQFGTCDVGIVNAPAKLLTLLDYKFGMVPQHPRDHKQMKGYALGFMQDVVTPLGIEITTIRLIIEQPRCFVGGRYYKHFELTVEELFAYGETLRLVAEAVDHPDTPFNPTAAACEYCPLKKSTNGCAAHNTWLFGMLGLDGEKMARELSEVDFGPITPERRAQIVLNKGIIEKFLQHIYDVSHENATEGYPDPGIKLSPGPNGKRIYKDELAAELITFAAMGPAAYNPPKLKSITQAEKDLKPGRNRIGNPLALGFLNELVTQDRGKPLLVADNEDRRSFVNTVPLLADLEDLF